MFDSTVPRAIGAECQLLYGQLTVSHFLINVVSAGLISLLTGKYNSHGQQSDQDNH